MHLCLHISTQINEDEEPLQEVELTVKCKAELGITAWEETFAGVVVGKGMEVRAQLATCTNTRVTACGFWTNTHAHVLTGRGGRHCVETDKLWLACCGSD